MICCWYHTCLTLKCVLSHVVPGDQGYLVSYTYDTFTQAECGYAQVGWEAATIIFLVTKYYKYLWGQMIQLVTDYSSLTSMVGPRVGFWPLAAGCLQWWALLLNRYTDTIMKSYITKVRIHLMHTYLADCKRVEVATMWLASCMRLEHITGAARSRYL